VTNEKAKTSFLVSDIVFDVSIQDADLLESSGFWLVKIFSKSLSQIRFSPSKKQGQNILFRPLCYLTAIALCMENITDYDIFQSRIELNP
jgi:hypothetical protein